MTNEEHVEKVLPKQSEEFYPASYIDGFEFAKYLFKKALDRGDLIPRERLMTHEKIKQTINTCVCEALHQSWSDDSLVSAIADDLVGKVAVKEEAVKEEAVKEEALLTEKEMVEIMHNCCAGASLNAKYKYATALRLAMLKKANGK